MAQRALDTFDEFPEWYDFFLRKKHLGEFILAQALTEKFGGYPANWRQRVRYFRRYYNVHGGFQAGRALKGQRERDKAFLDFIKRPYPEPRKKLKSADEKKIVTVTDPHERYSCKAVWDDIEAKHSDAFHIHINGDFADFHSKSRFTKYEHEGFSEELGGVFDRMDWLSRRFHRVTITKGNHDIRVEKWIAQRLDSDMLWLTERDLLRYMAGFFPNVEIVGQRAGTSGQSIPVDFVWQLGEIVFTHIERSQKHSSVLMDTIAQQLGQWASFFKLKPYRWIIQGHNHRNSLENLGHCYGMLVPAAADPFALGLRYIVNPKLIGRPPTVGYAVIYLDDEGHVDYNRTRNYEIVLKG